METPTNNRISPWNERRCLCRTSSQKLSASLGLHKTRRGAQVLMMFQSARATGAQVCTFPTPFRDSMSAMGILRQLLFCSPVWDFHVSLSSQRLKPQKDKKIHYCLKYRD